MWLSTDSNALFAKGFVLREREDGSVYLFMQNYESTSFYSKQTVKRGIYYTCTKDDALRRDQSQKEKSSQYYDLVKKAEDYNKVDANHVRFAECRPQKIEQLRARGLLYTHAAARVKVSEFMTKNYPGVPFSFVDLEAPPPPLPAPVAPEPVPVAPVVRPFERKSQRKLLSYELSIKVLAEQRLLAKIEREKEAVAKVPGEQSVIDSFVCRKRRFQEKLDAGKITQTDFDKEMEECTAWLEKKIRGARDSQKRFEQYLAEKKPLLSPEALKMVAKYNSCGGGFYGYLRKKYTPWLWIVDQRVAAEIRRREEENDSEMVIKTLVSNAINKKIAEKARLLEEEKAMFDDFFESASSAVPEAAAAVSNVDGDAEEEDETDEDEDEDEQERHVRLYTRDQATFFFEMELDKAVLHRENKERIEASNKMRCTEEEMMRDAEQVDKDTQRAPKRRREPPTTEQL